MTTNLKRTLTIASALSSALLVTAPLATAQAQAGITAQCRVAADTYAREYGEPGSAQYNMRYEPMYDICTSDAPPVNSAVPAHELEIWLHNYCLSTSQCYQVNW